MNLFLLTAPYQILNALEAIHRFQFSDNHLRILDTGHFTAAQFNSVVDPKVWKSFQVDDFRYKLTHLNFGPRWPENLWERTLEYYLLFNQIRHRRRADHIARHTRPLDNLILGNYQKNYDMHMRHLACRMNYKGLYLLDVGTDTLRISHDRARDNAPSPARQESPPPGPIRALKQKFKSAMLDWDTRGAPSLTFFTTYDLKPSGQDRVVRNEYAYLRSVVANAVASDKVLFVGQPLVDQGYITRETFSNCMGRIKAFFAGQRLIYIAHPRESEAQLNVVRDLSIGIQRFAAPFEYAIAFSGERPNCVASFFSSAVENSSVIFGDTVMVRAFRLPDSSLLKDHAEVARVYRQFAGNRQSRIDIGDIF
jgi:hypothetical protein